MGHRDAGVYQAYINERVQCNVQAAFLGRPSEDALYKAVTHMSRYVDPRAPIEPTSEEIDALKADSGIVHLRELRDQLSREVREESGTIKKAEAEGTKMYQMYKKANDDLRCAKKNSLKEAVTYSRQRFFDTIDTIEINIQLDLSFLDLNKDDSEPRKVVHRLEERRLVADLICRSTFGLNDQAKLNHRIQTANAILALCQRREAPRRQKPDRTWGIQRIQHGHEEPKPPPLLESCAKTQCIFCFYNLNQPYEVRFYNYHTVYKTRNHVELHLDVYKPGDTISCPDPDCQKFGTVLHSRSHFMNHATREHNYDIFRRRNG